VLSIPIAALKTSQTYSGTEIYHMYETASFPFLVGIWVLEFYSARGHETTVKLVKCFVNLP
jgi:hypothetical protein